MCLYIRADADIKIGIGHIMRCLALGQAWQDQGGKVIFISHCESNVLRERIINAGFDFIAIKNPHPDPSDIKQTSKKLSANCWLILDGYHFTPNYQQAILETGIHLLVIDDMNHLICYYANIILNQNLNAQKLIYNCTENSKLLLGPSYVFLRREFKKYNNIKRMIPECARKILVSLGGADSDNVTLKVVQALHLLGDMQMEVTIVVGPAYSYLRQLNDYLQSNNLSYHSFINPPNLIELMAAADLAITAGGGTYWELAFMGVPCLVIVLSENQQPVVEELARLGIVSSLGWYNFLSSTDIANAIHLLMLSKTARTYMSRKGQSLISGEGATLTIEAIKSYQGRNLR